VRCTAPPGRALKGRARWWARKRPIRRSRSIQSTTRPARSGSRSRLRLRLRKSRGRRRRGGAAPPLPAAVKGLPPELLVGVGDPLQHRGQHCCWTAGHRVRRGWVAGHLGHRAATAPGYAAARNSPGPDRQCVARPSCHTRRLA
jgi:hypothetical protein